MRRKLLVGGLVAAAWLFIPAALGEGGTTQALTCGTGTVGVACGGAETAYGIVCAGGVPVNPGTIEFITLNLSIGPVIECPTGGPF